MGKWCYPPIPCTTFMADANNNFFQQKKYDTQGKLAPKDDKEETEILSWVAFQISGLGPSQGQANWFLHFHSEKGKKIIHHLE